MVGLDLISCVSHWLTERIESNREAARYRAYRSIRIPGETAGAVGALEEAKACEHALDFIRSMTTDGFADEMKQVSVDDLTKRLKDAAAAQKEQATCHALAALDFMTPPATKAVEALQARLCWLRAEGLHRAAALAEKWQADTRAGTLVVVTKTR